MGQDKSLPAKYQQVPSTELHHSSLNGQATASYARNDPKIPTRRYHYSLVPVKNQESEVSLTVKKNRTRHLQNLSDEDSNRDFSSIEEYTRRLADDLDIQSAS